MLNFITYKVTLELIVQTWGSILLHVLTTPTLLLWLACYCPRTGRDARSWWLSPLSHGPPTGNVYVSAAWWRGTFLLCQSRTWCGCCANALPNQQSSIHQTPVKRGRHLVRGLVGNHMNGACVCTSCGSDNQEYSIYCYKHFFSDFYIHVLVNV